MPGNTFSGTEKKQETKICGSSRLSRTNDSQDLKVFLKPFLLFFGQNNYTNHKSWTIFSHKARDCSHLKIPKIEILSTMAIKHIYQASLLKL